jgi:proton-translocating NADH-quinone oxidoreductase chain M
MLSLFFTNKKLHIFYIALIGSILNLIQILILFENYDFNNSLFQFKTFNLIGIDGLSLWLILLVGILLPIILLNISYKKINKFKLILLISISYISIIIFIILDILIFYISYEILLIPMYYLIGYYGSRNRKITALFEFYIYTLIGSLLLLLFILIIYYEIGYTSYENLINHNMNLKKQEILFLLLLIAFGIKIPMIPVHIWLPEAHVEAPTSVSVY